MAETTHYYEDCGAEVSDDDVIASEPFGITCEACTALLAEDAEADR